MVVAVGRPFGVARQVAVRQRGGHLGAQPLKALEALLSAPGPVGVGRHPAIVAGRAAASSAAHAPAPDR